MDDGKPFARRPSLGEKKTQQSVKQRKRVAKGRTRTAVVHLRTLPQLKAKWDDVAEARDCSLTTLIEEAMTDYIQRHKL